MLSNMIQTVGIYGSGQIGKNLAILFCGLGLNVIVLCRDRMRIQQEIIPLIRITKKLNSKLLLQNINIQFTENIEDLRGVNLVIECVAEKIDVKEYCLRSIDSVISRDAIIASTTSTNSITKLASFLSCSENFIGLHFFNPPTLINFLEVICGVKTSERTLNEVLLFLDSLDLKYVLLKKENPGFIVNRALFLMLNEAIIELYEGLATEEQIDMSFVKGLNHPMGPLELCDLIGLDVVLDILQTLQAEYDDTKYRPCNLLKQKVRAGYLGKKTKQGFYKYK